MRGRLCLLNKRLGGGDGSRGRLCPCTPAAGALIAWKPEVCTGCIDTGLVTTGVTDVGSAEDTTISSPLNHCMNTARSIALKSDCGACWM